MRPTTFLGLAGLVVVGMIIADIITHPVGTTAAGNQLNAGLKVGVRGLLGVA